jgi:hypothetical protein
MESLAPGGERSWRLGARMRKGVLVVHIVSAGAWIGIDVVMGVLIFTALLIAFMLAVFKPWGRIRKRPAPREDER